MFAFDSALDEADYFERVVEPEELQRSMIQAWFRYLESLELEGLEDLVVLHRDGSLKVPTRATEAREKALRQGSHARYLHRLRRFQSRGAPFPRLRHGAWWLFHNCVAHMAIGVVPCPATFRLHDWTSSRLNLL